MYHDNYGMSMKELEEWQKKWSEWPESLKIEGISRLISAPYQLSVQGQKAVRKVLDTEIKKGESIHLSAFYNKEDYEKYLDKLGLEQRRFLQYVAASEQSVPKEVIKKKLGLAPMQVAGSAAAIARIAKGLGKNSPLKRDHKRGEGGNWDVFYSIAQKEYKEWTKSLQKSVE